MDLSAVPNLPGFNFRQRKGRHHKAQTFNVVNNQRIEQVEGVTHERPRFVKAAKPQPQWRSGSLGESTTREEFQASGAHSGAVGEVPAWDAYDRHVLRFYGFFKEAVVETNLENARVRNIILYYYLEDDTAQVIERKQGNSGMPQGQLIRRHRFPNASSGDYLQPEDLEVGGDLFIYGRTLHLVDCDPFTRSWYEQAGNEQGPAEEMELDNFARTRQQMGGQTTAAPKNFETNYREVMLGGGHVNADMQQFLEYDRKVLRFYAVMDDLQTPQFERRPFELTYFLSCDEIEVREKYPLNCGRDNFPIFFRKGKMPKGSYTVQGPQAPPRKKSDYVDAREFFVGQEVMLLTNYKFFIYDADAFTRQYFKEEMGVELDPSIDVRLPERAVPRPATPPYTGYGSWDDSMGSVLSLLPKPPKPDFVKLFTHEGKILRFMARYNNPKVEDTQRVFVISFHLADDCVSIHEPPQRNLGIVTGKFLEKDVHMNQMTGTLFKPEDLLPGNVVKVSGHEFEMLDMDEYTQKLFQDPNAQFKTYDLETVLAKLREAMRQQFPLVRDVFRRFDKDHDGVITVHEFSQGLEKFGFANLAEGTVMQLMRHFDARQDGQVSYNEFCDALLDEDFPTKMMHTKPGVDAATDDTYAAKAKQKVEERQETAAVRAAVRKIGDIIAKRENMVTKILKEFSHLTHQETVTLLQVHEALAKTGHELDIHNVQRAVLFVMEDVNLEAIPYVQLFQRFKTSFHDVAASR